MFIWKLLKKARFFALLALFLSLLLFTLFWFRPVRLNAQNSQPEIIYNVKDVSVFAQSFGNAGCFSSRLNFLALNKFNLWEMYSVPLVQECSVTNQFYNVAFFVFDRFQGIHIEVYKDTNYTKYIVHLPEGYKVF